MTQNPRPALLRRARHRTAAIVLGALAGTGLLTMGLAVSAQQAAVSDPDTSTSNGSTSDGSTTTTGGTSSGTSSGIGSSTSQGHADGGSNSS